MPILNSNHAIVKSLIIVIFAIALQFCNGSKRRPQRIIYPGTVDTVPVPGNDTEYLLKKVPGKNFVFTTDVVSVKDSLILIYK